MNKWSNKRTNGKTGGCIDEQTNELMNKLYIVCKALNMNWLHDFLSFLWAPALLTVQFRVFDLEIPSSCLIESS